MASPGLEFQIAAIDFSLPWEGAEVKACDVVVDSYDQKISVPPNDPSDFELAWPVSESALARPQCSCLVHVLLAKPLPQDTQENCKLGEVKVPLKTLAAVRGACVDMWFRVLLRDGIRPLTPTTSDAAKIRLVLCLGDANPSPSLEVRRGLCGAMSFPDQVRRLLSIQQSHARPIRPASKIEIQEVKRNDSPHCPAVQETADTENISTITENPNLDTEEEQVEDSANELHVQQDEQEGSIYSDSIENESVHVQENVPLPTAAVVEEENDDMISIVAPVEMCTSSSGSSEEAGNFDIVERESNETILPENLRGENSEVGQDELVEEEIFLPEPARMVNTPSITDSSNFPSNSSSVTSDERDEPSTPELPTTHIDACIPTMRRYASVPHLHNHLLPNNGSNYKLKEVEYRLREVLCELKVQEDKNERLQRAVDNLTTSASVFREKSEEVADELAAQLQESNGLVGKLQSDLDFSRGQVNELEKQAAKAVASRHSGDPNLRKDLKALAGFASNFDRLTAQLDGSLNESLVDIKQQVESYLQDRQNNLPTQVETDMVLCQTLEGEVRNLRMQLNAKEEELRKVVAKSVTMDSKLAVQAEETARCMQELVAAQQMARDDRAAREQLQRDLQKKASSFTLVLEDERKAANKYLEQAEMLTKKIDELSLQLAARDTELELLRTANADVELQMKVLRGEVASAKTGSLTHEAAQKQISEQSEMLERMSAAIQARNEEVEFRLQSAENGKMELERVRAEVSALRLENGDLRAENTILQKQLLNQE